MCTLPSRYVSLAVVVAALFVAACANRDAWLTSPGDRARGDLLGADASALTALPGDTAETVIMIDPAQTAIYSLGRGNWLIVRAGGLCDLASDYGPGTWDLPCLVAAAPVTVTARTWYDTGSHPHIEFSPSLRFAPFDGNRASAELWLRDRTAARSSSSVIQYCTDDGCVDESASDTTMLTSRDWFQGYVHRRIKHFSGYQVSTGRDDDAPADTTGSSQ